MKDEELYDEDRDESYQESEYSDCDKKEERSSGELKPCPFCGGKAKRSTILNFYTVYCSECGIGTRFSDRISKEEAINSWNRRV